MSETNAVAILSVGQNGQVTIPSEFRKAHSLAKGGKVLAVRMGNALVMAAHDSILESICMRLEEAMKGSGNDLETLKEQALIERVHIVRKRYRPKSSRNRRRKQVR